MYINIIIFQFDAWHLNFFSQKNISRVSLFSLSLSLLLVVMKRIVIIIAHTRTEAEAFLYLLSYAMRMLQLRDGKEKKKLNIDDLVCCACALVVSRFELLHINIPYENLRKMHLSTAKL
jgi:hypothetical protein